MAQSPESTTDSGWILPENLKGKKVVLINHSDTLGGAAVVSFRLLQALRQEGVDARMVVYTKTSEEENIDVIYTRFIRSMAFCFERLRILPAVGFDYKKLFKVSTGSFGLNVHHHDWVKDADIVCLNWINQGLMSIKGIRKLHQAGKKIVWTLHDMWAMTGICHHAYNCDHYEKECGNCRFLAKGGSPNDLSHKYWLKKHRLLSDIPINYVTVSHWLENCARRSSLLKDQNIRTINNPFPIEQFYCERDKDIYTYLPGNKQDIILFGAARLDDPIKGIDQAIDALNYIFDNYPEIATNTAVYFFGQVKNKNIFDRLRFSHRWLGMINDFKIIRYLCASSKVILSTSLYETLGGTLIEGQAGGAVPVTFADDGRNDVVEHLKNGYIARKNDVKDLAQGIIWALNSDISRQELHDSVGERFAAPVIARQYIDLFSEIIDSTDNQTEKQ